MKTIKLLFTLLCIPAILWAQLPYQQSFETTTGYTTSVPFASSGSDFFERFNNANASNWTTAPITGYDGVWYIGAEDIDGINDPNSGPTEISVTTDGINISGATNLEVSIKVGASGDNGSNNRYESGDYLLVEYQLNGTGSWTTIGVFGGGAGGSASYFYHDVLRNGITGAGDDVQMNKDMSNITYNLNTIAGSAISGSTMMVRVRFSVAGPQEEVQFDDIRVTGTAASCNISGIAAGSATPCANNLYNRAVTVTYSNAPASGTLDVKGQSFAITGSPQTVTLINLPANGAGENVTSSFSASGACTFTATGLFTNLEPCVVCSISTITAGAQLPCSIGINKYAQEVVVTYSTPPGSGNLNVNGQLFPITGSPQTCLLTNLSVGGGAVNVSAFFTALPSCTKTQNTLFIAPTTCPCTINAPANLLAESFEGTPGIGYNTSIPLFSTLPDHFNVGSDADFTWDGGTAPIGEDGTKYISIEDVAGIQSLTLDPVSIAGHKNFKIKMKMAAPSQTFRYDNGDVVDIQYRLDGVGNWNTVGHLGGMNSLAGGTVLYLDAALNGVTGTGDDIAMGATMYDATFDIDQVIGYGVQGNSLEIRVLFSLEDPFGEFVFDHVRLDATKCDPVCSISAIAAGTQTPCVSSFYTQDVVVTFVDAPTSGTLDVNGQSFAIGASPQTVTLTGLTANGSAVNVTAAFSANGGCTLTETGLFTAPAACPAISATGLHFDGVDDYVNVGNVGSLNFERTDAFSIEAWVKDEGNVPQAIYSKMYDALPSSGYEFWSNSGYVSVYLINNWPSSAISVRTSLPLLSDGQWHHVAMSYNGNSNASGVNIYVDGVLQTNTVIFNSLNASIQTTAPAQLGARSSTNYFWNGTLDEVRVWNDVRTDQEIIDSKNCELNGNESGLVSYYNFNTGIVGANNAGLTSLVDQTSNGNDGTLTNFGLNGAISNWIAGSGVSGICVPSPTCTGTSLATGATANTNVFGIAWDVNTKCNPVTIKDIQATTIPAGATVNILTRAGTYIGHEDLITGWTIVGTYVAGTNSYLTGGTMNIQIPANSTQAFALALDQASFLGGAGIACEINPAAPAIVASNVDLEYTKGIYTTSPLIPTSPNAIFSGAMCYGVTPTPSFSLAFNMYDLNYPFTNGTTDPNTFYYGVTWAKRVRVLVSGGVGPFTYSWSNSQGYNTIAAHAPNQQYLQTPAGPSDMICEVTDLGTGCTETGFITVGWSDEYWCGSSNPNMYQMIKMCQGGATVCMNGQQAKAALLAGTATMGDCPGTPKTEVANEDSFIVYPNPTAGFTTMHYNSSESATATALIIDLNGRIISADEIYLNRGITEYGFDLSGLTNGMYFVQLRTQNSVETQKIQVLK